MCLRLVLIGLKSEAHSIRDAKINTRCSLLQGTQWDSLASLESLPSKNFGHSKAQQLTAVLRQQVLDYLEDKFQLEIDRQASLISTIQEEKVDLDKRLKVVFKERDDFRGMVREMVDVKARAHREKV